MTNNDREVAQALLKRLAFAYFLRMFQYNLTKRLSRRYS